MIAAAQEQFRQNNPHFARERERDAGRARRRFRRRRRRRTIQGGARRFTLRYARAAALYPARCTTLSAAAAAPASTSPARQRDRRRRCRAAAVLHHRRQQPQQHSLTKASSRTRTATTTSPTVSRCTAGAGGIAAPAPTFRAAVTAETSRPRASDRGHRAVERSEPGAPFPHRFVRVAPRAADPFTARARAPVRAPDAPARAAPERRDRPASSPRRCGRRRTG